MSADEVGDDLSLQPTAGDSLDGLIARAVAAPPAQPLISPETVIAERYEIERVLGVGGMGAVYLARDRVLDRQVALKLHRTKTTTSRLHKEAIAMARLAHPNVVTVFEVGTIEERTFVAMEYVEGHTLRGWLASAKPSRTDVLMALFAAGEGLAAAHAAGLVHRDVKPDNILIGVDGRVRIGDFGLAQVMDITKHGPLRVPITSETATGTVVGTPAYMAPEQIDGGVLDARTDQFGFSVVVWEALHGGRPFVGNDTLELLRAIHRATPATPNRGVPSRIRRVLLRGLAADPADRWPSVHALLGALRAAWRRPRRIAAVATAAVLVAGATAYAMWPTSDPLAVCDEIQSALDREFPIAEQIGLVARLGGAKGGDAPLRANLIGAQFSRVRVRATAATRLACRARASRQWSAELARTSDECLRDQARTMRELVVRSSSIDSADVGMLSLRLPDVERCANGRVLSGWRPLSADPTQTASVIDARAELSAASALLGMGQVAAATSTAQTVRALPVRSDPGVKGRLDLLDAKLKIAHGAYPAAEKQAADVYFAARGADDSELALGALSTLIELAYSVRRDPVLTQRWVRDGVADAQREKLRQPAAAAEVLLQAVAASVDATPQAALAYADEASALLRAIDAPIMEIQIRQLRIDALATLGKTNEALDLSMQNIVELERLLGPLHPMLAQAWSTRAAMLLELNHDIEANTAALRARKILDASDGSESLTLALSALNLGASLVNDDNPLARRYLESARALWVTAYGEDHPDVALVDANIAVIDLAEGKVDQAFASLRHGIAVQTKVLGPDHTELAASYYNLAVAERENKQLPEALADAQRARAIYELRMPGSPRNAVSLALVAQISNLLGQHTQALGYAEKGALLPDDPEQTLNAPWFKVEVAHALIGLGRDAPRAKKALTEARVVYAKWKIAPRLKEVDTALAQLR